MITSVEDSIRFIITENDGSKICSSNYWDSELAAHGKVFCSPNDGVIRLLVPETEDISDWCRKCNYVIYSRGPFDPTSGERWIELLFEDGSDTPFAIWLTSKSWHLLPAEPPPGRGWRLAIWTRRNNRPEKLWEAECRWRLAPRIPFLKPWTRQ